MVEVAEEGEAQKPAVEARGCLFVVVKQESASFSCFQVVLLNGFPK